MSNIPGGYEPTPSEVWQMKLVYIAVYVGLGLIDESRLFLLNDVTLRARPLIRESARQNADTASIHSATSLSREYGKPEITRSAFKNKFPSVKKTVAAFKKAIAEMPREQALAKWRWCVRDNSDSFVLRYVRQFGDSRRAASLIGRGLVWQATKCNAERTLSRGESYFINVEPDPKYIYQYKEQVHMLVGHDKTNSPIFLCRASRHDANSASREAMQRVVISILEHMWRSLRDDSPGAMLIWDLTDWHAKNYDTPLILFMIKSIYRCYPMVAGRVFMYNAPLLFRLVWNNLLARLDPIVKARSGFLYGDGLLRFIDKDQLPECVGGEASNNRMDWTDPDPKHDLLLKDASTREALEAQRLALLHEFEDCTVQWLFGDDDLTRRSEVHTKLLDNFWQLDPYWRPKHIWDRKGLLQSYCPEFAGSWKKSMAAAAASGSLPSTGSAATTVSASTNAETAESLETIKVPTLSEAKLSDLGAPENPLLDRLLV